MSTHVAACRARIGFSRFASLRRVALCGLAVGFLVATGAQARAQTRRNQVDAAPDPIAIVPVKPVTVPAGTRKNALGATSGKATLGGIVVENSAQNNGQGGVEDDLKRGRDLLAANDARAIGALRAVAQRALNELRLAAPNAVASRDGLVDYATTSVLPENQGPILRAREQAARAHYWWGSAEVRLGDRDRAITALARAVILSSAAPDPSNDDAASDDITPVDAAPVDDSVQDGAVAAPTDFALDSTTLRETRRNASQSLNGLLRQGLPLVAPDDVLSVLASRLHGGLWHPRRFRFDLPTSSFSPAPSVAGIGGASSSREFLITSGKLFPSETRAPNSDNPRLWRVPPLYSGVAANALPPSLKMDRTVAGYERDTSGPDAGLWHQKVRVFYASTYVTRDNRDDRPRAETMCAQFLKVAALMREGANLSNRYSPDGVSTLWLCEVSALWPADDANGDDVSRPLRAPLVPAATSIGSRATREIVGTPLWRPWHAGAWLDSAPGDILLFRLTQNRDEAEWLRELIHEYSHIAVPPFAGFAPPLEPFGNGALGETLGMLWAASEARTSAYQLVSDASADIVPRRTPRAPGSPTTSGSLTNAFASNSGPSNASRASGAELNAATSFAPVEAWEDAEDVSLFGPVARPNAPRINAASWSRAMETHVSLNALPALRVFNARGPLQALPRASSERRAAPSGMASIAASSGAANSSAASGSGGRDDLRYLQGIAVYLERVYGAPILSAALAPLATNRVPDSNTAYTGARNNGAGRRAGMAPLLNASSLLDAAQSALRAPFQSGQTRLPIWLPGAMSPLPSLDAAVLATRAPLRLRRGQTVGAWLFLPPRASSLRVQWRGAASTSLQLVASRFATSTIASNSGGTLSIATGARAGWQRLIFRATGDLELGEAWFERAAS